MKKLLLIFFMLIAVSTIASASAATVDVTPDNPIAGKALTCTVVGGTPTYYYYYWYKNENYQVAYQNSIIPTGITQAGEVWKCKVYLPGFFYVGQDSVTVRPVPIPLSLTCNANPTNGATPLSVAFAAIASGGTGTYTEYNWDFKDGSATQTTVSGSTSHTYTGAGSFYPIVSVTDSQGNGKVATCPTIVTNNQIQPITGTCNANPTVGTVPLAVEFSVSANGGTGTYTNYRWNFNDGNTLNTNSNSASYTYVNSGTYNTTITVTDNQGNTGIISCPAITANSQITPITVSCSADPTSGYAPLNVAFSATVDGGTGTYTNYKWTFNDGSTQNTNSNSIQHTYNAGTYNPTLTVTDNQGNSGTANCPEITASPKPTGRVDVTPDYPFEGDQLTCTVINGTSSYYYYYWYKDDVYQSAYQNNIVPQNVIQANEVWKCKVYIPGNYYIGQDSVTVRPRPLPLTLSCSADPTSGDAPLDVSFTATASGGTGTYTNYKWTFNDGSTTNTNNNNTQHTYSNPGTYKPTITVTDSNGQTKTANCPTITANEYIPPLQAICNANPTFGTTPLTTEFTGTATGGKPPYKYTWEFGNGQTNTTTANSMYYTYQNAGNYNPKLTITDNRGQTKTANCPTITAETPIIPINITCTAYPISGFAPHEVRLIAFATGGSGTYNNYEWDFKDGTTQNTNNNNVWHTYNAAGTYKPTITVTDSEGQSQTAICTRINVFLIPPISGTCNAQPTFGNTPLKVNFTTNITGGTGTYTNYEWNFGEDGTQNTNTANTTHIYNNAGNYNPTVKITDNMGNTKTLNCPTITAEEEIINITGSCEADPKNGTAPLTTQFTFITTSTKPYTYKWTFDDGTTQNTNTPNTQHTYNNNGTYKPTVRITYINTTKTFTCPTITVHKPTQPITISCNANPKNGTAPLKVNFTTTTSGGTGTYYYYWTYGDGQSNYGQATSTHTYSNPGTFKPNITVTDSEGNTQTTNCPTITANQIISSNIISDDFNYCTINPMWEFINPVGDGSFSVNGTNLLITVPQGTDHNVWTAGNRAPRMMQSINNADFEVEVKFESPMMSRYQSQGIIIEQDPANFIRTDFFHDGSTTRFFVAKFVNNNPVVIHEGAVSSSSKYIRVTRVNDNWLIKYGSDGSSWNSIATFSHQIITRKAGVFASNSGLNPAHTASIDYFFNNQNRIDPEDAIDHTKTLTTNVIGNGIIEKIPNKTVFACNEKVTLKAIANQGSIFSHWTGSVTGSTNPVQIIMDTNKVVTATFISNATPITLTCGAQPTSGNTPLNVLFTATANGGTGTYTNYKWTFNDATTQNTNIPNTLHTYNNAGTYKPNVTVTDSLGQTKTAQCPTITASSITYPNITGTCNAQPTSGTIPLKVNFSASITGGNGQYTYKWIFNDGNTTNTNIGSTQYVYYNQGVFNPYIEITDTAGNSAKINCPKITATTPQPINHTLTCFASPTNGTAPLKVNFNAQITSTIGQAETAKQWTYTWIYDDGTILNTNTPNTQYTYNTSGLFKPKVRVMGNNITLDATCPTIAVTYCGEPLVASCHADPTSGYAPLLTTFNAMATGGIGPYSYEWIFGDGTSSNSTSSRTYHTYDVGTFTPLLTVRDSKGMSASAHCPNINVQEFTPKLSCDASPTSGSIPLNVHFHAITPDEESRNSFVKFEWIFGDGQSYTGDEYSVYHIYESLGNFSAILKGYTSGGRTITAKCPTITTNLGNYSLHAEANGPYKGYINQPVMFTAEGSYGRIVKYVWRFGDGTYAETLNPILYKTYNKIGVFDVRLTVYDVYGYSASDTAKATIIEPFTPTPVEEDIDAGLWIGRIMIYGKDRVQEIIRPNDDLHISLDLKNYYDYKLDDARIIIEIPELGIKQKSSAFDLSKGASKTESIDIPMYDVPKGHYYIKIIVQDDNVRRVKYRDLFVQDNVKNSAGCYYNYCGGK